MSLRLHERLLSPLVRRLAATGVSPDTVTLLSVPPAVLAGLAAAMGQFVLAGALLLLGGLLDLIDGSLARATGRQSRFGALLDSTLDRISDACVPVGLVVFYAPHGTVVVLPALAIAGTMAVPYVRARAQSLQIALPRLWMRREDRLLALVAALLLTPLAWPDAAIPAPLVATVCGLIGVLGLVATFYALAAARRLAAQADRGGEDQSSGTM